MASKTFHYGGEQVDVHWDSRLCIHVSECGRAKGELFVGGRKPWCQPDLVSNDAVAEVCERCPTGALTYDRKDNGPAEQAAPTNTVTVLNNGPLYLRGELAIDGAPDDMQGVRFRAALCRCGLSKNKPFCDNSHEKAEFHDSGAVGETGEGTTQSGGPLNVTPVEDGPLVVNGNLTIIAASGLPRWSGIKTALCRCGHSNNKPFCDGTHKTIGFRSG
ncbi:MAG: CDGSH iron-sulfur domain-containing protein [Gammaproteobacteria bacterium]